MKRLLLFCLSAFAITTLSAQCVADYDFGDSEFGVSPDPENGESFEDAFLDLAYEDVIHMLVPTDAGDVDSAFIGFNAMIDSLKLIQIDIVIGEDTVPLSTLNLDVQCNNNGDSPDPCTFMGGQQYCALIEGTPNMAGEFPLMIVVEGYLQVFGQTQAVPYVFDQFTFVVSVFNAVEERSANLTSLGQNIPNPAVDETTINYSLNRASNGQFLLMNLVGEVIESRNLQGASGANQMILDTTELNSGIYLYSVTVGGQTQTKRMVINK